MPLSYRQRPSRKRFEQYRHHLKLLWKGRKNGQPIPEIPQHEAAAPENQPIRRMLRPRGRTFLQLLIALLGLMRGRYLVLTQAMVVATVASIIGLLPPYGTKLVIDNVLDGKPLAGWAKMVLPSEPSTLLAAVALSMVGLAVGGVMLGVWSRWTMTLLVRRTTVTMRRRAFDHISQLPLHRVIELKSGGVASILRDDAGAAGDLLFNLLYNPWKAIIQLAGSLFVLAWVDWRLLIGGLCLLPIVYYTHRTWISRIRPIFHHIRDTRRFTDAHATEAFGGIRVVRGFGRRKAETAAFSRNNHLMARQELFSWWWMRGVDMVWSTLIPVATAGVLWYGGWRIMTDAADVRAGLLNPGSALTTGQLVMFLVYLGWLLGPISMLANTAASLQNNLAGLDRILDLMKESRELPDRPNAVVLQPSSVGGAIDIQNVSFTYPGGERPVLRGVNLSVRPGQTIALVGRSGAGKTTLCNLVARFYDPSEGRILLDGRDLRDIKLESFRGLLGIVEQDVFLFDGTVRENIAYSDRRASQDQIEAAARRASAHEFICGLAQGYDTLIGERGVKLSGGQRQRISIARALLADPRLLILDEATSNLDTESEQAIQKALAELLVGRTTFVIAHRLSTIRDADLIVVMQEGQVIESGTHDELVQSAGVYYGMLQKQRMAAAVSEVLTPEEA